MKKDLLAGDQSLGHGDMAMSLQTAHVRQSKFGEKFMQITEMNI